MSEDIDSYLRWIKKLLERQHTRRVGPKFGMSKLSRPVRRGICLGIVKRLPRNRMVYYHGNYKDRP